MTETHVVVYCDTCGDLYTDTDGESICFDSTYQAIAYLTALPGGLGWVYDGDQIVCNGCEPARRCDEHGHAFPDPHDTTPPSSRRCLVCGAPESESQR